MLDSRTWLTYHLFVGGTENSDVGQSISVIPDDVRAIGRYAYQQAQTMRQALQSVVQEVEHLTSAGWSGDAAKSFARGWSECEDSGSRIIDALSAMAAKLGVTADNYRDIDTANGDTIWSLDL